MPQTLFPIYAGPCSLEDMDLAREVATELVKILPANVHLTFKGSFDKANRTSLSSPRGPGLEEGLKILATIKEEFKLPVITDFHLPEQAMAVAEVADVLQIPAFLCRQTDMILAAGEACKKFGRTLNIKKGQFMAPEDMKYVIDKARSFLPASQIVVTERGTSFGYRTLIVDMGSFSIMKQFGVQVFHDATHCIQRPSAEASGVSGGRRELTLPLARAALAAGASGLFFETHPRPDKALSDGKSVIPLSQVANFFDEIADVIPRT